MLFLKRLIIILSLASIFSYISCNYTPNSNTGDQNHSEDKVAVTGIQLSEPEVQLYGVIMDSLVTDYPEEIKLTAVTEPDNASNKNIIWTSSDTDVATVDNTGKVIFQGQGTAVITAETEDGGFKAVCSIEATDLPVYYAQCDSEWGNIAMGESSETICSSGTVLTCCAMMLTLEDSSVTPQTLNTFLTDNSGYDSTTANLYWGKISEYSTTTFTYADKVGFDLGTLRSELDYGNPVLITINNGAHWVLVLGYKGEGDNPEDYVYLDPGYSGSEPQTRDSFTDSTQIVYYHR